MKIFHSSSSLLSGIPDETKLKKKNQNYFVPCYNKSYFGKKMLFLSAPMTQMLLACNLEQI